MEFLALILSASLSTTYPALRAPASQSVRNQAWDRHQAQALAKPLQEACKPWRVFPPAGVPIKGKVIALHGYSACPQQFWDLAKKLAPQGYATYMMLLPGHGGRTNAQGVNDVSDLPRDGEEDRYAEAAEEAVRIAQGDSLPTTLAGLSVGAVVALDAALRSPQSFRSLLLMSPFFAASNRIARRYALPLTGLLPFLKHKPFAWGEGCTRDMQHNRAGFCAFELEHLHTVQDYGTDVVGETQALPFPVQVIGVAGDSAASNQWTRKATDRLASTQTSSCLYPQGTKHAILSRYDGYGVAKPWMTSLERGAVAFITRHKAMPSAGASEFYFPLCSMR
jgi:alpha-beta hydrolase superfamily lysophospholipase